MGPRWPGNVAHGFCTAPAPSAPATGNVAPVSQAREEPRRRLPPTRQDLIRWSEALSGIARTGLGFTQSLYERERFDEVMAVAGDIRAAAEADEGFDAEHFVDEWMQGVGEGIAGYITPKVAVGAVVHNDAGEILLVQRADSGIWLYPTGWADVGYSASEIAVKEVREETGIECVPVRLIALLDGLRLGFTRVPLYSLVFLCRATGGELEAHPLETSGVGWFPRDAMPEPLAGADQWLAHANRAIDGDEVGVLYDEPRERPWAAGAGGEAGDAGGEADAE
jgi:ADP-ribose pyrophosphatase YjhB (NUDIX family)